MPAWLQLVPDPRAADAVAKFDALGAHAAAATWVRPDLSAVDPADDAVRERIAAIDLDSLAPRDALALLYELKDLARD